MKKGTKDFLIRWGVFSGGFFLIDRFWLSVNSYPKRFTAEWFGGMFSYVMLGYIIFGVIPFSIKYWKKTNMWRKFADKWQLDKKLPDR